MLKVIFSYLLITISLFAQWNWLYPQGTNAVWLSFDISENNTIWLAGEHGTISKTTDFGATWQFISYKPDTRYDQLKILSETEAIAFQINTSQLVYQRDIVKTTDGGETWQSVFSSLEDDVIKIVQLTNGSVIALTQYGYVISDKNLDSWRYVELTESNDVLQDIETFEDDRFWIISHQGSVFVFNSATTPIHTLIQVPAKLLKMIKIDESTVYLLNNNEQIIKTFDSGANWEVFGCNESYFDKVYFLDALNGYNVKSNDVLRTTDGGINWELYKKYDSINIPLSNLIAREDEIFFHDRNGIYRTEDNFYSFESISSNSYPPAVDMMFFNKQYGVMAASPGIIQITTNSGFTWEQVFQHSSAKMQNVKVFQPDTVYIYGSFTALYRSYDRGLTWNTKGTPAGYDADFPTTQVGYIVGETMTMYKTIDAGFHWKRYKMGNGLQRMNDVHFISEKEGWTVGGATNTEGIIMHTSDGLNFEIQYNKPDIVYHIVKFYDANNGWVFGYETDDDRVLLSTSDGGSTWKEILRTNSFSDFHLFGPQHGIALAGSGGFYETTDGGESWEISVLPSNRAYSIFALDREHIWLSTGTGMLSTLSEPILVDVEDSENLDKEFTFSLNNNYPNPFNPTTTITFTLPEPQKISLKVFNMLGKEVATLFAGSVSAGEHNIKFDGTNLSSGIYFYQLITPENSITKKMILIK